MTETDLLETPAVLKKAAGIDAKAIRLAMLARWADPEYAIMWEVGRATGAVSTRWADAVIMSLWPSRGLELHGVEIKVSKYDWRREAADPTKAEAIAAYCDRWWVHTSPNVIEDVSELPPAWGWREYDGLKWTTRREATLTTAAPCDRQFLAALLRRADTYQRRSIHEAAERMIADDRAAYEERVKNDVERRTRRNSLAAEQIEKFEAASGIKLIDYCAGSEAAEIGALVKAISESGVVGGWQGLQSIIEMMRSSADRVEGALRASGLPMAATLPPAKKKGARL